MKIRHINILGGNGGRHDICIYHLVTGSGHRFGPPVLRVGRIAGR